MTGGVTVDEYRCYLAERCPERERVNGQWHGASIVASRGLCYACTDNVREALIELPADYVRLSQNLAALRSSALGENVAGSRELPIPINEAIEALRAAIDHNLQCWAEIVAERTSIGWDTQAARDCRPGIRVQQAAALLVDRLPVLVAARDCVHLVWLDGETAVAIARDGIDAAVDLVHLHNRARRAVGDGGMVHHLPAPCPNCERTALQRRDGAEKIRCAACTESLTIDEYDQLVGLFFGTAA